MIFRERRSPWIVGITGFAGSGKDAAASILIERYGYKRVAFADPMKRDMTVLDPLIDARYGTRLSNALKDASGSFEEVKRNYPEVRRLLQHYGTEVWRSIDVDIWAKRLVQTINEDFAQGESSGCYVVPDLRFMNEFELVNWGTTLRVERPGVEQNYQHASEDEISSIPVETVVQNVGDIRYLSARVEDEILQALERKNGEQ